MGHTSYEPGTLAIIELIIISVRRKKSCKISAYRWGIFCSTSNHAPGQFPPAGD